MNLLAIDPGSIAVAFAYFVDGEFRRSDLIRPRASLARLERMHYIGEELGRGARTRGWNPDVVAIEDVYVGRNTSTALLMSNTVGYLERVIYELFPRTVWQRQSRARICWALGLKGNAKGDDKRAAARTRFPALLSQDECDAAAVGLAALLADVPR